MQPKVALIVLTHNARDMVCECLESVFQINYDPLEIIVVDSGSVDDTSEVLQREYGHRIHLITISYNARFSRANNEGIRYALGSGARYIMLINDDTAVDPMMIRELVAVAEADPGIGAVGPKIYYWRPPDRIWFAGGRIHLHKGTAVHIGIRETDTGQYDEVRDVDYITGCGLMARREAWEQVGLLDPLFKAYCEDSDWCLRARRYGWRMTYVPAARMWHKISAATGGQVTFYKFYHRLRSGFFLYLRHASWYHFLTIPFFQVIDSVRVLLLLSRGGLRNTWEEPPETEGRK